MSKFEAYLTNYDSQSSIDKRRKQQFQSSTSAPIFILCDACYWCATYFSNRRLPLANNCPQCNANSNQLTSFPIASNESFTFNYNDKRGIEFEFKPRSKRC
jgi:hypothetical protein